MPRPVSLTMTSMALSSQGALHADRSAAGGVAQRIGDEIRQHLPDARRIDLDQRKIRRNLNAEGDARSIAPARETKRSLR